VRWQTKVSPDSTQYFFHADPVVAGDVLVAGADRPTGASIHAFDRATGKEVWKYAAGRGVNGPLAAAGQRVYAATVEARLLSLDVRSGALLWSLPLKVPGWEGPAAATNRVFAGTTDGSLYALNAETGRQEWRAHLGVPVTTSINASEADVYAGTADGSMHRVDARSGAVIGSRNLDAKLKPSSVPMRTASSVLVLLTDQAADYRALTSVDLALERIQWQVTADKNWTTSRVFVWGDVVVLGTASGSVDAYCKDTGAPAWSRSVNGPVRSIGGAQETLLVGTRTGGLYAFRAPRSCDGK
jgi:outer membrane protein assembly factor BamB